MMSLPFRQATDAGSPREYRLLPSRTYLFSVLLLASVLVGGCLPVADPVTRSRIRMGTGPNHHLSKLVLTQRDATRTLSSATEIRGLLRRVEVNLWELRITDLW